MQEGASPMLKRSKTATERLEREFLASPKVVAVELFDPGMKSWSAKSAGSSEHRRWAAIMAACVVLMVVLLVVASSSGSATASIAALQHLRLDKFPDTFRIAVIADLDQSSKKKDKNMWSSIYMTGSLRRSGEQYSITWDTPAELSTSHNEAGRGCELSELVKFEGKVYTFDDRTGIMFEVSDPDRSDASNPPHLVPRAIFMEGDGTSSDKGMKVEWATVKDGTLVVGSFGKEFTNNAGAIVHANNLWVVNVRKDETVEHVDWQPHYSSLRTSLGYSHPGYLLHEAIAWSPHHRKWYIFPRRMSKEVYEDVADEKRGANTVIVASHDFTEISAKLVGKLTPERGFSSVKFLPGSRDSVIIALKSEENASAGTQRTFMAIYGEQADGTWKTLMEETQLPIEKKFEGVEVLAAT